MKKLVGILTGVGAVNWLLVGLFDWDLVMFVFRAEWLITVVYVLIGLSGIIFLVKMCGCKSSCGSCKTCDAKSSEAAAPEAAEEPAQNEGGMGGEQQM